MIEKYLYINTIGCQMNVYDSERIAQVLKTLQYKLTSSVEKADLIIVNTCAIREKAEQKVFSFLGRLSGMKKGKPGLIIGVGGCVAQQDGEKVLARMPFVDIVFGTHAIARLPEMIKKVESGKSRVVNVDMAPEIYEFQPVEETKNSGSTSRFVTIMQGCDNYCTYCVVPYVRGREMSRLPADIIKEITGLAKSGVREITLLGQNVNSYGKKEGLCSFPEMLESINEINSIQRIRFTTSHPKDLSLDLIKSFKNLDKLCKHFHLPVQSGSDRILKKMNRKYTSKHYFEKISTLRDYCPEIAISSDFIVGFPGETESDFMETLEMIKTVGFDSLFAFKYSDRPNAPASRLLNKISDAEKKKRLKILLEFQKTITLEKNKSLIGSTQEVLVEGLSKKESTAGGNGIKKRIPLQWTGRTSTNKIVNFTGYENCGSHKEKITGKLIRVRIDRALSNSLQGKSMSERPKSSDNKGEESYAA